MVASARAVISISAAAIAAQRTRLAEFDIDAFTLPTEYPFLSRARSARFETTSGPGILLRLRGEEHGEADNLSQSGLRKFTGRIGVAARTRRRMRHYRISKNPAHRRDA